MEFLNPSCSRQQWGWKLPEFEFAVNLISDSGRLGQSVSPTSSNGPFTFLLFRLWQRVSVWAALCRFWHHCRRLVRLQIPCVSRWLMRAAIFAFIYSLFFPLLHHCFLFPPELAPYGATRLFPWQQRSNWLTVNGVSHAQNSLPLFHSS